jgi:hypothetical protein
MMAHGEATTRSSHGLALGDAFDWCLRPVELMQWLIDSRLVSRSIRYREMAVAVSWVKGHGPCAAWGRRPGRTGRPVRERVRPRSVPQPRPVHLRGVRRR